MLKKPIIFLDFDRTLFDTERFYEWLGEDRYARILAIAVGELTPPDFSTMLYPDTLAFLQKIKTAYRPVLLTYSINIALQRRKVRGSGILPYFSHIIITSREKGIEAQEYLVNNREALGGHVFVDDTPEQINDMRATNPMVRSIRIERALVDRITLPGQPQESELVVSSLDELLPHLGL
jgi:FMN phosphatase YigB (HAD superfamily)